MKLEHPSGESNEMKDQLLATLQPLGQDHLLSFWEQLTEQEQSSLADEIQQIDLELVTSLFRGSEETPDWDSMARRAEPPAAVRLAAHDEQELAAMRRQGEQALQDGRVGMILVAGGQGTRLGFDHPKGMFPIGPISQRTLFQVLIDRLRAVGQRYGKRIPLYVMTSPATDAETAEYFAANQRCGLADEDLKIFCQGVMPAVDAQTGRILQQTRSSLALSPDGHGGMLAAFAGSGCFDDARRRGIDILFYGQIDNPLLQVCDPLLIGCHLATESEMTTQVVPKAHATERVGNVVMIDGRTRIIEYSDLPDDVAEMRDESGALKLWAGNLAVHVFDVAFLSRMMAESDHLPFHRARKKTGHIDEAGQQIDPAEPNSIKFEKFIFDLLPAARRATVVESAKEDSFAPVKNAAGASTDTALTAQKAMVERDRGLLGAAGVEVSEGVDVEINPLWALDAAEIAGKVTTSLKVDTPTYFRAES